MKRPLPKKLPGEKLQRQRLNILANAPKKITQRELDNSIVGQILSRRRTRRVALSLTTLSMTVLLGIVAIATFSPALALKEIIVSGTERIKPGDISNALRTHLGTPLPLLSEQEIASSLEEFELIESFSATALPPNGLQVKIAERQPISIVSSGQERWLYDPAGIRIAKAGNQDLLPEILITENPVSSARYKNAIDVLLALPENLLDDVEFIEAKSKDDVRMSLRSDRDKRIVWGDSSDSVLKSKVLQALMRNHRRAVGVTFDVSSPNAPVVRFDNF